MNVMIIPEDFRKDRYVLEPVVQATLAAVGKPRAKVRTCLDPLLGSVEQALTWERVEELLQRYRGMVQLFLLCVDRDGKAGRRASLAGIEDRARERLGDRAVLLGENAWQEIEVWLLAGHDLPAAWSWEEVRADINPKENYYLPFARARGLLDNPGEGRKTLGQEAARRYHRIRQLCPEDVAALEDRVRRAVEGLGAVAPH
jgi:hypothetical protein